MPTAWPPSSRRSAPRPSLQAAACLVHAADQLGKPDECSRRLFGPSQAALVAHARKLASCSARRRRRRSTTPARPADRARAQDAARLLARPARRAAAPGLAAADAAPLRGARNGRARRRSRTRRCRCSRRSPTGSASGRSSGSSRTWPSAFSSPSATTDRAPARRAPRRARVARRARCAHELGADLAAHGIDAQVQGRPKHLYSIWKKMRRKGLDFERVLDVLALRVIVADVAACYAVLGRVHERFRAVAGEFDDYIARPKANGYRSLHTVVRERRRPRRRDPDPDRRDARARRVRRLGALGLQGSRRRARRADSGAARFEARVAEARLVVLRQLLAWERDIAATATTARRRAGAATRSRRTLLRRPHLRLHAAGHRRRADRRRDADRFRLRRAHRPRPPLPRRQGRRRDGAAQHAAEERPDGRDHGREERRPVARLAQRRARLPAERRARRRRSGPGSTRWRSRRRSRAAARRSRRCCSAKARRRSSWTIWPTQLGFRSAEALFEVVGKDELSLRSIETLLRPAPPAKARRRRSRCAGRAPRPRRAACWWSASSRC